MKPITVIQSLRGIAAMMVVWSHSLGQVSDTPRFIHLPEFGHYGVDLFFVISGFIMLVTTWDKPITPRQFIGHRIRRVVPLYWTATLVMVGIAMVAPSLFKTLQFDTTSLLKSLLFIPYHSLSFPGTMFPLLTPGWTLDYEMFFYALFAISLFLKQIDRLPVMLCTLICSVATGMVMQPQSVILQVYTSPRLLEFAAGMALGRVWLRHPMDLTYRPPMLRALNPILHALGDASYSIYLTHIFTLGALRVVWVRLVPDASMTSSLILMAVSLVVSASVGWLCYRWVERPLTQWGSVSGGPRYHTWRTQRNEK
jgi:exopolysaccharide production protein ExoZ